MNDDFQQKRLNSALEQAEIDGEKINSSSRISALDPDFIVILFFVAIPFDIILAILAIFDAFVLPWILGMIISFIPFGIIVVWHHMRISDISKTKESVRKKIEQTKEEIKNHKRDLMSTQEVAKQAGEEVTKQAGKEVAKQAGEEVTKQAGKEVAKQAGEEVTKQAGREAVKQTAKSATKTAAIAGSKTVVKKGIISLVGTSIPFIGIIPFYTIWVLSTLKEE